jgi:hypothetical protein
MCVLLLEPPPPRIASSVQTMDAQTIRLHRYIARLGYPRGMPIIHQHSSAASAHACTVRVPYPRQHASMPSKHGDHIVTACLQLGGMPAPYQRKSLIDSLNTPRQHVGWMWQDGCIVTACLQLQQLARHLWNLALWCTDITPATPAVAPSYNKQEG